jgi:hypothetical protein
MSRLMDAAHPKGRAGSAAGAGRGSIREVSLVGRPPGGWSSGDRVAWAGRSYCVVEDSRRYVHLRPEPKSS